MKAPNSRKTCKQHYLFKHKQRKLSLTNKDGESGVFKAVKLEGTNFMIYGDSFAMRYCFREIKKIVNGTRNTLSIGEMIDRFEIAHNVKIERLGLTREDFAKENIDKIVRALENK